MMVSRSCQISKVLSIALVIGYGACSTYAHAQEPEFSAWLCERCAGADGWDLDIEAGFGHVSSDAFKFGDYTGLDEEGAYVLGDVFGQYWSEDAHHMRFEGYRLGLDSRAIFFQGGKQGLYNVRASYQGIPRRIFDSTTTVYSGNGSDQLSLPEDWVRAPTIQGMSQLNATSRAVKVERDWDVYGVGIEFTPHSRWRFDGNYKRTEQEGQRLSAGSFFLDAAEFVSPVNYATDDFEMSAGYDADRWQISMTYFGSFFDNDNTSLTWDNAFASQGPGDERGQMALPPDNKAHQLTLAGSMLLPANTTFNGQVSVGRMEQDESLLPYTINSQISAGSPPVASADSDIDTTNINLRVVSSPLAKFSVQGEFRYHERDNDTAEDDFNYVITDLSLATNAANNTAYDYERYDYRLRGEYRILSQTRLFVGYDHEKVKRRRQERNQTTNDRIWFQVKNRPISSVNVDMKVYAEDRDGSDYRESVNEFNGQNPLMRKYNMANRKRNGIEMFGSLYPNERMSVGLEIQYNKDDHDDSDIGLLDSSYMRMGADFSYLFAKDVSSYAALYSERIKSKQANSQSFSDPDWVGRNDDRFYTAALGLTYPRLVGRLGANLQYAYSRSTGEVENNTGGLASSFPDLRSTLHQVKLAFDYPHSDTLTVKFGYIYESFDSDDWALEGIEPNTVPNLLSLGADPYNYDVHVFFTSVQYMFAAAK